MGQGLGKNTPVKLTLGRENYEALIDRHGQWIRWRVATKCACVDRRTMQPNIHCKLCGGRGVIYSFQPKQTVQCIVMTKVSGNILELDAEYENDTLLRVYNYAGETIKASKEGLYIVTEETLLKGVYYNIVLERDNLLEKENVILQKCSGGYWKASDLENGKSNIDGIFYTSPSDIVEVGTITDSAGYEFEVEEKRLNQLLLKPLTIEVEGEDGEITNQIVEPTEPVQVSSIKYVKPYTFAILNQNLSKGDLAAMTEANGDAVCTYPYYCDVANDDILTVLAGTITNKDIVTRTSDTIDKLSAYFVADIVSIIRNDGTEYINGLDYVLTGTNNIKWLTDGPEVGDGYSVTYKVYPTYVVIRDIPQLRTSENQRFPKKAIVKYMSTYSEQKKVNRQ
jgi:hypothetical protein